MEKFIQSAKTRLGADCGSDHELLIAKFRLKLKQVGKTTRPFWYDLLCINQIPYNCTVEVAKRFKGLDLIARVPEELWMEVLDIVQEVLIKIIPRKKKCKKANSCLRRPYRLPLSTLQYLRRCRRSTATASQGSTSTEGDGKCLCHWQCFQQVSICSWHLKIGSFLSRVKPKTQRSQRWEKEGFMTCNR